jgi:hypothetical protein
MIFLLQIHTVAVGAAIGQACLLLAAGTKGHRYMMPHAKGMMQWACKICNCRVLMLSFHLLSNIKCFSNDPTASCSIIRIDAC